jgi:hypothetical protein
MSITAGAASNKIIELKSKLAIYASWVELIKANYLPYDGGAAEVTVTRDDDGGVCSEQHFQAVLADIDAKTAEIREELGEWEGLVFEPSVSVPARPLIAVANPAAPPVAKKPAVERSKLSGRRLQPATK